LAWNKLSSLKKVDTRPGQYIALTVTLLIGAVAFVRMAVGEGFGQSANRVQAVEYLILYAVGGYY
jgi:hypothetical protein